MSYALFSWLLEYSRTFSVVKSNMEKWVVIQVLSVSCDSAELKHLTFLNLYLFDLDSLICILQLRGSYKALYQIINVTMHMYIMAMIINSLIFMLNLTGSVLFARPTRSDVLSVSESPEHGWHGNIHGQLSSSHPVDGCHIRVYRTTPGNATSAGTLLANHCTWLHCAHRPQNVRRNVGGDQIIRCCLCCMHMLLIRT